MSIESSNRASDESGILCFDGSSISYTSPYYGTFSIPLSEIAVIGEVTNQNGPGIDDWFIVFVPRCGSGWFEASMYADNCDPFLGQLSAKLGVPMARNLYASTDFASCIIWPVRLAGCPVFTFKPVTDSNFLRRLKLRIMPETSQYLSEDTLSVIEQGD